MKFITDIWLNHQLLVAFISSLVTHGFIAISCLLSCAEAYHLDFALPHLWCYCWGAMDIAITPAHAWHLLWSIWQLISQIFHFLRSPWCSLFWGNMVCAEVTDWSCPVFNKFLCECDVLLADQAEYWVFDFVANVMLRHVHCTRI